ncbi:MAG: response regulator [Caldithrix sp.]|nr:response regulator [Caldithrix sp.]
MNVLLIDDDGNLAKVVSYQLHQAGYTVDTAADGGQGLERFKKGDYDIVICDIQMPDMTGIDVLKYVREIDRKVVFIIITAYGSVDNAIEACRLGADDYLSKPFGKEQLIFTLEKAVRFNRLQSENIHLKNQLGKQFRIENMVAKSGLMRDTLKMASQVAASNATVLIQGESGTGKELIARAIHYNSERREQPLITINCPSIPDHLMESELFGHIRGAFTGAYKDRTGKFQLANGGTVFLDEIGDLSSDMQAKLLRVLQEREFDRVGEDKPIKVDVRVITATNRDLQKMVEEGTFREDLFYRLSVVPITIPPLRDRTEDIPYLVDFFLRKYSLGHKTYEVEPEVMSVFKSYHWPGNVRELENIIERLVTMAVSSIITKDNLPRYFFEQDNVPGENTIELSLSTDDFTLDNAERKIIQLALNKVGHNRSKAARLLKVPRHVLLYRMKKLSIE